MNSLYEMNFKRKFSVNLFKNTKLSLAKMTFSKDWISTDRGNAYPVISSSGITEESVYCNTYIAKSEGNSKVSRLIGQYVPFATYEITSKNIDDGCCVGVKIKCDKLDELDVFCI